MALTKERGKEIREVHSTQKEKEVCDIFGLEQKGGSHTKIDGTNGKINCSIKNFTSSSSQVHLTTQRKFISTLMLDENSTTFVQKFCGSLETNHNGRDRYYINEIEDIYVSSFMKFLDENKVRVIDLIVRNGFDVNSIVYRDMKTSKVYTLTYNDVLQKIQECTWVKKRGGIHLKNKNNKTYFHIQREGKRNKNNRYNVLWHINRNIFLEK